MRTGKPGRPATKPSERKLRARAERGVTARQKAIVNHKHSCDMAYESDWLSTDSDRDEAEMDVGVVARLSL